VYRHLCECAHESLQGKPVAAALVRVFGRQLAELPLVATQYASRRQGHARVLMSAIEGLLAEAGVQTLSLPAAQETVRVSDSSLGNHALSAGPPWLSVQADIHAGATAVCLAGRHMDARLRL
jgi:hypothetical protein